jgi:hypothetical protein
MTALCWTVSRKVDNLKQKLAARRIQRTWKHFYQEVTHRIW